MTLSDKDDRVDELTALCLDQIEKGLDPDIEAICASEPELVKQVRQALRALEGLDVLPRSAKELRKFGEFELLEELGRGGMGVVWLARQTRLRRPVALKLIRPGLEWNERSRIRFDREVRALSQLDHPNICTVFEADEIDGRPYLAMRYVDGESLADRIAARRSERVSTGSDRASSWHAVEEAIRIVEKIARALEVAHGEGVVHRDVKPANILIESGGEPVLVDFGLAFEDVEGQDEEAAERLTLSGDQLGTPNYMAPEQVRRQQVGPSTDVYALAVTLFECIALRPPFDAPDRVDLYQDILNAPPPNLLKLNRAAGRDLCAVLEKALEKDSRHRFASALEFADELLRILNHEPILTRRPGSWVRSLRWCQRNRAAAAVLAIVVIGLVTSLYFLQSSVRAEGRFRALALLEVARRFENEDPKLSFQLSREALDLHDDQRVLAYVQEAAFRLPDTVEVREDEQTLEWADFSPTGAHFFVFGASVGSYPSIHRASDGKKLADIPYGPREQRPAIAFSPSGDEIAISTHDDGRVLFWRLEPNSAEWTGPGDELIIGSVMRRPFSISWHGDGAAERILVTRLDGSAVLYRRDGHPLHEIPAAEYSGQLPWQHQAFAGAFLPDGGFVAAGRLWNADGTPGASLGGHTRVVQYTYVAEDTDRLVIAEKDGAVRLYDLRGQLVHEIPARSGGSSGLHHAELDPAGEHLVVTYLNGAVHLHDTENGLMVEGWQTPRPRPVTAVFSADGERVLSGDWDGRVEVRSLGGALQWSATVHVAGAGIFRITVDPTSPPGRDRILTAGWDGRARLTTTTTPPGVRTVMAGERPFVGAFSDGSGRIATGASDGSIVVYDSQGKEVDNRLFAEPGIEPRVRIASDGRTIVAAETGGGIMVWNPGSEPEILPTGLDDPILQLLWAERLVNGSFLLMQARGGPMLWTPGQGGPAYFESPDGMALALGRASPSGARFALGTQTGAARLYDAENEFLFQVPRTGAARLRVSALGFRTEDRVALALQSGEIELWDLPAGELLHVFEGHTRSPSNLEFSPERSRLASVAPDGVRVWDVETEASIMSFRDPAGDFVDVAWIDSDTIVTSARGGFVRWWELDVQTIREAARGLPLPRLSEEEIRQALGR